MTPQERELVIQLLARVKQHAAEAKDPEAEALIRQAMAAQPDAPYFLVQTVLMQDMALQQAQERIRQLEAQAAPAKPAATSFLGGAGRGSVPSAGAWTQSAPAAPPPPPAAAWTQGGAPFAAAPSPGSSFLHQAATTAAGIAGGALLFEGIRSLFGSHWGGGFLGGMPMQPSISETVINNYEGGAPQAPLEADAGVTDDDGGFGGSDADIADTDFGDTSGDFDV
ncbi:MAG TPA: DUF2076 domain-containing protein [Stellaceae bacterium]|nr:DUF2076 domain-containing protein [Stellaceae bacterium]